MTDTEGLTLCEAVKLSKKVRRRALERDEHIEVINDYNKIFDENEEECT